MRFGYARVSTEGQCLDRQIEALTAEGIDPRNIYTDKISGVKQSREGLDALLDHLREGDSVTVLSLNRLARSTRQLLELSERFEEQGVDLISLHEKIDTSSPAGKLFFTIAAAFAEFDRNNIKENQREGIAAAKARGKHLGRPTVDKEKLKLSQTLYDSGNYTVKEACSKAGISDAVFYKYKRLQKQQESD